MKKILVQIVVIFYVFTTLLTCLTVSAASNDLKLYVNGGYVQFDTAPKLFSGNAMLPVDDLLEYYDYDVEHERTHGAFASRISARKNGKIVLSIVFEDENGDGICENSDKESPWIYDALDRVNFFEGCPRIVNDIYFIPVEDINKLLDVKGYYYDEIKAIALYDNSVNINYETLYNTKGESVKIDSNLKSEYVNAGYVSEFSDVEKKTVYALDGRTKEVYAGAVAEENKVGWYSNPSTTVYAPDGRSAVIEQSEVNSWTAVGWYTYPVKTLYAENKSEVFPASEVAAQLSVGWYEEPVTRLYAEGKSQLFLKSEAEAQLGVGWYKEPVQRLYAPEKTQLFVQSEVAAQLSVGWYEVPVSEIYTSDGRTMVVPTSEKEQWKNDGWFVLEEEKAKHNLNTGKGIEEFLERFYPQLSNAVGTYSLEFSVSGYDGGVYNVRVTHPYNMINDMTYNTDYSVSDCERAQDQVMNFMYKMANDVMKRTTLPIEMCFYQYGYAYPSIRVGFSSTQLCTCRNYSIVWVDGPYGTTRAENRITGFNWCFALDDYDIYKRYI